MSQTRVFALQSGNRGAVIRQHELLLRSVSRITSIIQLRVREIAAGTWEYTYTYIQSVDVIVHEPNLCKQKKHKWKYRFRNILGSQSNFDLIDCVDAIGAISVGDGGVLLTRTVAE